MCNGFITSESWTALITLIEKVLLVFPRLQRLLQVAFDHAPEDYYHRGSSGGKMQLMKGTFVLHTSYHDE